MNVLNPNMVPNPAKIRLKENISDLSGIDQKFNQKIIDFIMKSLLVIYLVGISKWYRAYAYANYAQYNTYITPIMDLSYGPYYTALTQFWLQPMQVINPLKAIKKNAAICASLEKS